MFHEVELEWTVVVQPDAMKSSAHIQRAVILALLKDFNDVKCTQQHGYHVAITNLEKIGEGRLWERRGCAAFPVRFRCVVFNVFKGEYVLAVVKDAGSAGVTCQCGPFDMVYISKKYLTGYEFLSAEVDDLLAVTKWSHTKKNETIKKGDVIKVRILGTNWDHAQRAMTAAGSLLGDDTGVDIRWPEKKATETQHAGGTADGGWGDPLANVDDDGAASGWGAADTNEDDIGNSEW